MSEGKFENYGDAHIDTTRSLGLALSEERDSLFQGNLEELFQEGRHSEMDILKKQVV
jgi:hypothetical protein